MIACQSAGSLDLVPFPLKWFRENRSNTSLRSCAFPGEGPPPSLPRWSRDSALRRQCKVLSLPAELVSVGAVIGSPRARSPDHSLHRDKLGGGVSSRLLRRSAKSLSHRAELGGDMRNFEGGGRRVQEAESSDSHASLLRRVPGLLNVDFWIWVISERS